MQFKLTALLTGIIIASGSFATPIHKKRSCTVNANIIDTWYEGGAQRYQIAYSTTNTCIDMKSGCDAWSSQTIRDNCAGLWQNVQCYYSSVVGSWVIDDSEALGPVGWTEINCMVSKFRLVWANKLGCNK
ncbi:hypothetical protein MPER_09005 [Moniliophthora perniciosa FA553]|nr:hypothetical protein MPER_09005 [Moniliophthora perniciosa FA553]